MSYLVGINIFKNKKKGGGHPKFPSMENYQLTLQSDIPKIKNHRSAITVGKTSTSNQSSIFYKSPRSKLTELPACVVVQCTAQLI